MTGGERLKKFAGVAAETGAALLLVLALFWLFILFLFTVFPSGTPIKEMVSESGAASPLSRAGAKRPEAALQSLVRDVRCRRGDSVAWGDASEGMILYNRDAVQTFDRSGATISFAPGDRLAMGSNSMVVVTRLNETLEGGPRSYRVHVEGELRGSFSSAKRVRLEVATAGHLARVVPGGSRFTFTPLGENASSLTVHAGEVQVRGEDRVVRVPARFGVTLRRGVPVGPALPLPAAPRLKNDNLLYRFRLLPPRVRFDWTGAEGAYHFQLSAEPRFRKVVLDSKVNGTGFDAGTLEAGDYYWRVSRVEEGREGPFSRTGHCRLLQQLNPPRLEVDFPPPSVGIGGYRLAGRCQPGSSVYVNGDAAAMAEDGSFSHEIELRSGVNLIRVEAVDQAGNASYASRVVYGKE
ncbi:FecR family protein [Geomonas subterranea]|uniref:FecR family protein n=1 Tax=Geomonas subterranea TaxID=2847989 RepID=A0ABX8LQH5_9BACT|nr:FecR family protein [Geomonas subterranea]QXE92498.1 FecR family protein [Geomonas subterranea]QXM09403.1 FecR family protein [Geomonas subterranea]